MWIRIRLFMKIAGLMLSETAKQNSKMAKAVTAILR